MTHSIYLYIAIMAGVSFLIRTLPLTLIRRPITNRFLRSFLFYVPYVTLAVMTFPAIVQATQSPLAGALALVCALRSAARGRALYASRFAATHSQASRRVLRELFELLLVQKLIQLRHNLSHAWVAKQFGHRHLPEYLEG